MHYIVILMCGSLAVTLSPAIAALIVEVFEKVFRMIASVRRRRKIRGTWPKKIKE